MTESGESSPPRKPSRVGPESFLARLTEFLRRGRDFLFRPDAEEEWRSITADRVPVSLPERPIESSYPDRLLTSTATRELLKEAREMEAEDRWYSALELYLEVIRRAEKAADGTLDVTLFNRIGDLHRRLAAEWYLDGVDRYAERDLRRGAVALCEKALYLVPDHPHGVRRHAWLARTEQRRGRKAVSPTATNGDRYGDLIRREGVGAGSLVGEKPDGAPATESPPPAERLSEGQAQEESGGDWLTDVFVPDSAGGPKSETGVRAPVAGDADDDGTTRAKAATLSRGGADLVTDRRDKRVAGSGDPEGENLPRRVVLPPPDSVFERYRVRSRLPIVIGVVLAAAAVAIVLLA